MEITKDKVATIDYTLKNDAGDVLDTSQGAQPLSYLHGARNIIPGLESALEGQSPGDELEVTVPPDQAYGTRNEGLRQQVDRSQFKDVDNLEVGMQFRVPTNQGDMVVHVADIEGDTVTVDGNHQLAGMTLHFDVAVRDVREATEEEKSHGHVHGANGHAH